MTDNPIARIVVASHFFKVTDLRVEILPVIGSFIQQFIQYEFVQEYGRTIRKMSCVYAAATKKEAGSKSHSEYRFHINTLPAFKALLRERSMDYQVIIEHLAYPVYQDVEYTMYPEWKDRDYQIPALAYAVNPAPHKRKMLPLDPGRGKSYMAMRMLQELRGKGAMIMRKGFIEKWELDFAKTYDMDLLRDVVFVSGKDSIMALTQQAVDGTSDAKLYMISNSSFMRWVDLYEELGDKTLEMGYACRPDELLPLLNVKVRVIDEVHLDFHANFKLDLYTHAEWSLSLSGSMDKDDLMEARMVEIAYPYLQRYLGDVQKPYVEAVGVMFRFEKPHTIRSDGWKGSYSQVKFEQSILKQPTVRKHYLEMLTYHLDQEFKNDFRIDDRLVIFVGTVEMATFLQQKLEALYPERPITRYCRTEKDILTEAIKGNVIITTLQSGGTNVDIPGLRTAFLYMSIDATASNIQGYGRLRNNVRDGLPPKFYWFTNVNNPKHMRYHRHKEELLRPRVKSIDIHHYPYAL